MQAHFPSVKGSNLSRKTFNLPQDFAGSLNLLFIAFLQIHQRDVDTWVPTAEELTAVYPQLRYYELPVIRSMNFFSRSFIDGGMRMGIADKSVHDITITLYLDKQPFRNALKITRESEISVMLVDRQGDIYWRETGPFTPEKGATLEKALAAHFTP